MRRIADKTLATLLIVALAYGGLTFFLTTSYLDVLDTGIECNNHWHEELQNMCEKDSFGEFCNVVTGAYESGNVAEWYEKNNYSFLLPEQ